MSIIRDVLNENGISVEDLIKVKESFENNVLSHEEFNEMLDLKHKIVEKISAFLSNEIRTMDEVNEMVRKIIEYTNASEIKQILNQVVEIKELMNSINVYSSVNKIESMVNKCKCQLNEILKRKPFVTMVEMERYLLDEQHDDLVIKINNMKFDNRFYELYRKEDPYNGFFRGGGISMFDFIVLLLNNIDTY